jgi:hypothetical protein
MKTITTEKASLIVLWCAFGVFLLASIPHLAYFFASMEPLGSAGEPAWWFWWAVSFGLAGAFDLTDVLLSMRVAKLQKQKQKPTRRIIRTWLFIIGLTALSVYANYEHAAQFSTTMLDKVTNQTLFNLPLDLFKFGTLNPILGSFFQLFAIAYTSMAEDIASEEPEEQQEEDLETLRKRAQEAEERARLQATITACREPQGQKLVKGVFGLVKGVREEVKDLRGEPENKEAALLERAVGFLREMPHLLQSEHAALADTLIQQHLRLKKIEEAQFWRMRAASLLAQAEIDTDVEANQILERKQTVDGQHTDASADTSYPVAGRTTDADGHLNVIPTERFGGQQANATAETEVDGTRKQGGSNTDDEADNETVAHQAVQRKTEEARIGAASPLYMTLEEASAETGYTIETLKTYVRQGKIKRSKRDQTKLLSSTVLALRHGKRAARITPLRLVAHGNDAGQITRSSDAGH